MWLFLVREVLPWLFSNIERVQRVETARDRVRLEGVKGSKSYFGQLPAW
jgi:hypothetical protein